MLARSAICTCARSPPSELMHELDRYGPRRGPEPSHALDDLDQLSSFVSVTPRELHQLTGARHNGTLFGLTRDRDSASAAELEQSLVSERAQRSQNGIGVHADYGRQVFGWWKALAGAGLTVGDRAADLSGDLLVEVGRGALVDLDSEHDASYISFIVDDFQLGS